MSTEKQIAYAADVMSRVSLALDDYDALTHAIEANNKEKMAGRRPKTFVDTVAAFPSITITDRSNNYTHTLDEIETVRAFLSGADARTVLDYCANAVERGKPVRIYAIVRYVLVAVATGRAA